MKFETQGQKNIFGYLSESLMEKRNLKNIANFKN